MAEFNISISGEPGEVSAAVRRLLGLAVDIPISGNSEIRKFAPVVDEPLPQQYPTAQPVKELEEGMQICQRCGEIKVLEQFCKSARARSGYTRTCLKCYVGLQSTTARERLARKRESKLAPEADQRANGGE